MTRWIQIHIFYTLIAFFFIFSIRVPQTFPDSASYRSALGNAPWNWISLTGTGYARGWPIELFYSIFNTDLSRTWMQSTFYFVSVTFLSYAVFVRFNKSRFAFHLSLLVLFLGQLGIIQSWNNYISRESLSNSLLIICFSTFTLSGASRYSKNASFFLCIQAIFSATTIILKPTFYPILIAICVVQLIQLARLQNLTKLRRISVKFNSVLVFTLILLLYATVNAANQNIGWSNADPEARTLEEISFSYVVSEFNPSSKNFIRYLDSRRTSDKCSLPKKPIETLNLGQPMIYAGQIRKDCPDFSSYVEKHYKTDYVRFLATNPEEFLSSVSSLADGSFSFLSEGKSRSFVQPWVGHLILLDIPIITAHMIVFCLFSLSFIFGVAFYNRQNPLFKSFLRRTIAVTFFIFAGLISIIFSVLFQPTHPSDLSRQSFSSNLFIRLCIIWLLIDFCRVLFHNFRFKKSTKMFRLSTHE